MSFLVAAYSKLATDNQFKIIFLGIQNLNFFYYYYISFQHSLEKYRTMIDYNLQF